LYDVTLAGDSPPAGDLLSCCTTRKKAKKRTPLSRPLRGFPPSGNAGRGLRKLALRAQTCEALFRPSSPPVGAPEGRGNAGDQRPVLDSSSAGARCIRKARSDPAEQRTSRRGSRPQADRGWRVAFFASFLGEARKEVARRGEIPANDTQNIGTPVSKGTSLPCRGESAFHT